MLNSADFTFDKLIRLTVSSLEFPAVNSRQNEAELIVSEAFNIPINELRLLRAKGSFVNDFVADNQLEKKFELLKNLVTKRNEGVPLQHLTQKANFWFRI